VLGLQGFLAEGRGRGGGGEGREGEVQLTVPSSSFLPLPQPQTPFAPASIRCCPGPGACDWPVRRPSADRVRQSGPRARGLSQGLANSILLTQHLSPSRPPLPISCRTKAE
jgi:hypothetical protein